MPSVVYVPSRIGEGHFTDFQTPASGSTDNGKIWAWNSATSKFEPITPSGGGTPGGSSGQVQWNNGAGGFGGNAGMTYDAANSSLTVSGSITSPIISLSTSGVINRNSTRFAHAYTASGGIGRNTFLGENAGNLTLNHTGGNTYEASKNTGVGFQSLAALTTGYNNVGLGSSTLASLTTGAGNIAIGTDVMSSAISASLCVAIGSGALATNTASSMVAVGSNALGKNTSGNSNVAMGAYAAYNNQTGFGLTAIGAEALRNGTAWGNTAIGYYALNSTSTGERNTGIGYNAGSSLTTGSANILIGYNVQAPSATASNQLVIGSYIVGDGSALKIKPYADTTGGVLIQNAAGTSTVVYIDTSNLRTGIGQATPTALLDVAASTTARASLRIRSGTAPTTPNSGDVWQDDTEAYIRLGGVTYKLNKTAV